MPFVLVYACKPIRPHFQRFESAKKKKKKKKKKKLSTAERMARQSVAVKWHIFASVVPVLETTTTGLSPGHSCRSDNAAQELKSPTP